MVPGPMSKSFQSKEIKLAIDIGDGQIQPLDYKTTEDPDSVAGDFCEKYKLAPEAKIALAQQLKMMSGRSPVSEVQQSPAPIEEDYLSPDFKPVTKKSKSRTKSFLTSSSTTFSKPSKQGMDRSK